MFARMHICKRAHAYTMVNTCVCVRRQNCSILPPLSPCPPLQNCVMCRLCLDLILPRLWMMHLPMPMAFLDRACCRWKCKLEFKLNVMERADINGNVKNILLIDCVEYWQLSQQALLEISTIIDISSSQKRHKGAWAQIWTYQNLPKHPARAHCLQHYILIIQDFSIFHYIHLFL